MNYSKLTAVAALATTILAGSMTAAINDQNRLPQRGLDPVIIELLQRAETGTLPEQFKPKERKGLKPRALDRTKKPDIGVRRDDTRLQIKFADELQVRIKGDGTVISRTNRSISAITSIIEDFELTLTPAIPVSEDRIDAMTSRAQRHAGKQTPDIGGMYWVDGSASAVGAAASVFHGMDDVEWVFWNTIMDPTKHTSDIHSIFSELHRQEGLASLSAANQNPHVTGACLLDERTCEPDVTRDACVALAGTYLGDSSICDSSETVHRLLPDGACCLTLIGGSPGCADFKNDGMDFETCLTLNAGSVFSNLFAAGTHLNGVWFDGDDCEGIVSDCLITPPPGASLCGDAGDAGTIFSGDCYHNQADLFMLMDNRSLTAVGIGGAPGCWDAPGFPLGFGAGAVGFIDAFGFGGPVPETSLNGAVGGNQLLCETIGELDPICLATGNGWDEICASLAQSSGMNNLVAFFQPASWSNVPFELSGLSGDCSSPFGNNFRPIPVNIGGNLGTQPRVSLATGSPVNFVDPASGQAYGCGWNVANTAIPGIPVTTAGLPVPIGSPTPDFGPEVSAGLGLIQHLTDEQLTDVPPTPQLVATVLDPALLAWPMGGAQVGSFAGQVNQPIDGLGRPTSTITNFAAVANPIMVASPHLAGAGLPVIGGGGVHSPGGGIVTRQGATDSRWAGNGLNLFADFTSTTGIGNGDGFSGLYGLGFRRQVETGVANGTHGAGVKIAVLDYAAYIQTYFVDTTVPPDGTVDTLIGGMHEDLSVDANGPDAAGTSVPTAGVLLEGTATGHTPIQMLFNPPDPTDYPFDYAQSPNHGTAQLGVIAASWGAIPNVTGTVPSTGAPPAAGVNFGAMGIAPQATTAFFPLMDNDQSSGGGTGGRVETAWFNAMEWLSFGDVISAGYVALDDGVTFPNIAFNPSVHALIETATNLGLSVVIAAGDNGTDLAEIDYPNDIDPGAIVACATSPGGAPAKRWADSVNGSNFVEGAIDTSRNTCAAWGAGVVTCGMGPGQDNWLGYNTITYTNPLSPTEVQGRSYTNNFGGTSAAAAISAGCAASIQGYARQVYNTPLGPPMLRHYMAHGQILGNDPDTGGPIPSIILSQGTANNVMTQTENSMTTTEWPDGTGTNSFDLTAVGAGAGNIVGYFADPRYACIRTTVDPIFDTPNFASIQVIRGTLLEGNINAIASIDGVLFAVNSTHTGAGEYGLPANVPGGSVVYNFNGESTDVYLTGVATDPRGNPLLTLKQITLEVTLAPTQATTTILQLWMWDFSRNRWVQPSVSGILPEDSTEQDFEIIRTGALLDSDGTFHARLVSITGAGPFERLPIYYDQIRLIPTIPVVTP